MSGVADATLNVVPTIDLLICIICFLLISTTWLSLSRLDVDQVLPKRASEKQATPPDDTAPPTIQVAITADGHLLNLFRKGQQPAAPVRVASLGSFQLCRGKKTPAGDCTGFQERFVRYDAERLQEQLLGLMAEADDASKIRVLVAADDTVAFLSLVNTLDAIVRTCIEGDDKRCLRNPAIGDPSLLRARGFQGQI